MPSVYIINVFANASHPFVNPLFQDSTFELIPIPEAKKTGPWSKRYRDLKCFNAPRIGSVEHTTRMPFGFAASTQLLLGSSTEKYVILCYSLRMAAAPFDVTPLTPVIGGEVCGIDLGQPPGEATFRHLQDALIRHQVLFFRDQDISVEAQMALGAWFGELVAHPNDPGLEAHPEVMIIHADETSKHVAGESWHSDVSCEEEPPMGSILRIHTLPDSGGDTLFASMYAAYEALSDPMKRFLHAMAAVHDGAPYYRSVNVRIGRDDRGRDYPRAEHPIIRTHPISGRKALFVNSMFTTHIVGLSRKESDAVLGFLYDHIAQPRFQCRFRWRKNSIAFWDNRCVQHQAIWDYWPQARSGYRVTIKGDRPV